MKRRLICFAAMVILLLSGVKAFSGDLKCYGYTSTTSHFECGTHGNCVWWAAYMRPDIAAVISGSGWNGGQWYDNLASKGFDLGSEPKIDAIVEFSGHVAYVKSLGENGSFSVSEMDYYGSLGSGSGVQYATYYKGGGNTYHRNSNRGSDKQGDWTLKGFIYRNPSGTNSYCADINSIWGICWKPSDTDVSCQGGGNWRLYDYEQGSVIIVSTNEYCPKPGGSGGGSGIPTPTPSPLPTNSPAQINYVRGRIAGVSDFEHGLTIYVNQPVNIEIETQAKNETGSDVKADFFFYLDDDKTFGFDSSHQISGSDTGVTVKANSKQEKHSDPIRINVNSPRTLYFYSKLTSAGASDYSHSNNSEQYFKLDIVAAQNIDLIIPQVQLVGQKTQITMGKNYRIEFPIRNVGTDTPKADIQSAYYLMKPGESTFTEIEQDGSDANELSPGRDQWEATPTSGYIPDRVGIHRVKVCTDINNNIPETNEANNCKEFTFEVLPAPSTVDFVISGLGFDKGTSIKKGSIVRPWANVRNIGTTTPTTGIRIAYYIDGKYRDDDGVDAGQLTPGRDQYESVNNNNIKLGDTGTRTLTVCADYKNSVAEMNESNNCSSITFKVKK